MLRSSVSSSTSVYKNQYFTQPFTQGPRFKNNATVYCEKLVKDILYAYASNLTMLASYNELDETVFTVNNHFFNLAELLSQAPDFDQLQFTPDDLAIYDIFLRDPKTAYGHIEDMVSDDELRIMRQAFPRMTTALMSAIRHYTGTLFEAMNYLLKFNAAKILPSLNTDPYSYNMVKHALLQIARKVDPNYNPKNPSYNLHDPVFLSAALREIFLNIIFTITALNTPEQDELNILQAASYEALQDNFAKVQGVTLAIIPTDTVYLIAYGQIVNATAVGVDIKNLLSSHLTMGNDGVQLSQDEFTEITTQLNKKVDVNLLQDLSATAKTKLINILTNVDEVNDLLYEKIYRVEEDVDYFVKNYLPDIYQTLNTSQCHQFYKVFYSSSAEIITEYKSPGLNFITMLINPRISGKNIQTISEFFEEEERLLPRGQEITYTKLVKSIDENNQPIIYLEGYPIRSIDENKISKPVKPRISALVVEREAKQQIQTSDATRVKPFYAGISNWLFSSTKSAGNFLYKNIIEKPVKELGLFSEFYFEYLNNLSLEPCTILSLATNQHSLFHANNSVSAPMMNQLDLTRMTRP